MNCKKCGRPKSSKDALVTPYELCCASHVNGDESCEVVAAAFRRGLLRGVEITKKNAYADKYGGVAFYDVNEAVKREVGDG